MSPSVCVCLCLCGLYKTTAPAEEGISSDRVQEQPEDNNTRGGGGGGGGGGLGRRGACGH